MRKHRENSLELIGWLLTVERSVMGSRQASRAVLRVEQGWCKKSFCKKRFAATCGAERNAMERSVTKVGYLPAGG